MRKLIVDASVSVKWVVAEQGTDEARALLQGNDALHAPEFMLLEVANVLWSKARRRVVTRAEAEDAYAAIAAAPIAVTPLSDLLAPARSLAFGLDVTVYDATYVALAQKIDGALATADQGLAEALGASGLADVVRIT